MKKEHIIKILSELSDEVEQRYKTRIKGIFGSFVRNEEKENSDIDILVEFKPGATLLDLGGLCNFLEEKLAISVDIVPIDTLRPEIKTDVLSEAIYI